MTRIITSLIPSFEAIQEASPFSDILEFRLDFGNYCRTDRPVLATLRTKSQGGAFEGAYEDELIKIAKSGHYQYIDIEYGTSQGVIELIKSLGLITIGSYHGTMDPYLLGQMPTHFIKYAKPCKTAADALLHLQLQKKRGPRWICLPLGQSFARVLMPLVAAPFTYGCLPGKSMGLGQISSAELVTTYRFRTLTARSKVFGLIGHPVDKSPSHHTHNRYLAEAGIDAVYVKIDVEAKDLSAFMQVQEDFGVSGLSVTKPLKKAILPYLCNKPESGACNTVVGRFGYNTDGTGALAVLPSVQGKVVAVLGAGGAGLSIGKAAQKAGATVLLYNRTTLPHTLPLSDFGKQDYDIVVSTVPHEVAATLPFLPGKVALDVVHTEPASPIPGAIHGMKMFEQQAACQWKLFCKEATRPFSLPSS